MTADDSRAIKICRVMCIFFMSYVHVNPGLNDHVGELPPNLSYLENVLSEILGRASVPALSVLGGYLAVMAYGQRRNWAIYVGERWQTLAVPLIGWNAIIILLSVAIWQVSGAQTSVLRDLPRFEWGQIPLLLDRLTAYNYGSATTALNFLRDIFVCSLLLPVLLTLLRRTGFVGLAALWFLGLTVGFSPVILRPYILIFFSTGICLALQGSLFTPRLAVLGKLLASISVPVALVWLVPAFAAEHSDTARDTLMRLGVSSAFLWASHVLSRFAVGDHLARLEPMIYLMFLSHACIMLVFWGAWQSAFGSGLYWPYGIFYGGAPVATLVVVLVLYKTLALTPAAVQQAFNGRRIVRLPYKQAAESTAVR